MDRGKIFEQLLRSNHADRLTLLVTVTKKWPRPAYAQRYFDQLCGDFLASWAIILSPTDSKLIREHFGF